MKPSANEARESLESIANSKRSTALSVRMPLKLNLITCCAMATMIFFSGISATEEGFGAGFWLVVTSSLIMVTPLIYWAKHLRKRGIVIRDIPTSSRGKALALGQTVFFMITLTGAVFLCERGSSWGLAAAGLAGVLNAGLCGYLAHRFPYYLDMPEDQS